MRHGALLLGLVLAAAQAAPPALTVSPPAVRMPVIQSPSPPAVPADAPVRLTPDTLYVIDSDIPLLVLGSPDGPLKVAAEDGPIRIRGKFADGTGKVETRTFKGKHVYTVDVADGKSGRCELIVVPKGVQDEKEIIRRLIDAGQGPQPPPVPPTPPTPPPSPAPIPEAGFRALIVYESADLAKLPASQVAVLTSGEVRGYLNDKCATGPDGKTKEWRVYDANADVSKESATWQKAMQIKRDSLPWLVISNGQAGYSGPLPATIADTLKLLKQWGN